MKSSLKLTKAGFFYTIITIFIGISAVNTGNNLLYVAVSFLLSFMWLSGIFARLNIKGLKISLFPPKECYARKKALLKVTLEKKGLFPSFLLNLRIGLLNSEKKLYLLGKIPFLKDKKELFLEFLLEKRGEAQIFEVEISSAFPASFFRRFLKIREEVKFLVFPEPRACRGPDETTKKKGEDFSGRKEGVSEFQGLSDFQAGTPKKLISWKIYAKWEELKRKVFSEEESQALIIDLARLEGKGIEERLSCATYLILNACEKGKAFGIKIKDKIIPPGQGEAHKLKILTLLAKYEED
ncbi:MAG: DUF58 domain-containing protein [Caldimicrobium sp.]